MAKMYRILACPFCGAAPVAFGSGEGRRGLMIECQTPNCVNPHTSYYDRDTAVRVWNIRQKPEREIVVTDADINATPSL